MGAQLQSLTKKNAAATGCSPFVKWAGGKRGIVHEIKKRMPASFNSYYEPFVGGGALFFALQPAKAVITDKNPELITAYQVIQSDVHTLMQLLDQHWQQHSRDYYYEIRNLLPKDLSTTERAARFIYLNKTCYNGLYRVNKNGDFNVPYGHRKTVRLYDKGNLLQCSLALQHTQIRVADFHSIMPQAGDFVYFDPPYYETFTQYTQDDFDAQEQKRLCDFCTQLDQQGVKFVLSNSDNDFIRDLYSHFHIEEIHAPRSISCNGQQRGKIQEVIVFNA